jgi:ribonuclease P protein component
MKWKNPLFWTVLTPSLIPKIPLIPSKKAFLFSCGRGGMSPLVADRRVASIFLGRGWREELKPENDGKTEQKGRMGSCDSKEWVSGPVGSGYRRVFPVFCENTLVNSVGPVNFAVPKIGVLYEENIPAVQEAPRASIWFPESYPYQEWPRHSEPPPRQGPRASGRQTYFGQVYASHQSLSLMETPDRGEVNRQRSEKLPRSRILRRRSVLRKIRTEARRRANRCMVLLVEPCTDERQSQAAFLTPKRIGSAHVRNRLRRQMREIYRRYLDIGAENRFWVWLARTGAAQSSFAELKEAMLQLCEAQKSSRRRA